MSQHADDLGGSGLVGHGGLMEQSGDAVACRHCGQALWHEKPWGWLHLTNGYLCRDPETGEVLFTPAEPVGA